MAKVVSDAPIYTSMQGPNGLITDLWRSWVRQVEAQINRTAPVTGASSRVPVSLTPGASPWTWQSPYGGDVRVLIASGTITGLAFSRDGTTYYPMDLKAGQVTLSQGDFLQITYTVVPTVTAVPA